MTLIAIYKFNDQAVIINDFRVSYNPSLQFDAMCKYKQIGNRMALFLAGSVDHWREAVAAIETTENTITIDNVLLEDGPLVETLRSCMLKRPFHSDGGNDIGAIGVLVDAAYQRNAMFYIHGVAGHGCMLTPIPDRSCKVIGSGGQVPDVERLLLSTLERYTSRHGHNLIDIGNVMRSELKHLLKQCGASSFRKLGISPVFAISLLSKAAFRMNGEEYRGEFFSSTGHPHRKYRYSFVRGKDGNPVLRDHLTHRDVTVKDITQFKKSEEEDIFDPEGLTVGFDPSIVAPTQGSFYIMNQWVASDDTVSRSVYEVPSFEFRGQTLCNPTWHRMAADVVEGIPPQEVGRFSNVGDRILHITDEVLDSFKLSVMGNLFNHQWLAQHIANYDDIYQ